MSELQIGKKKIVENIMMITKNGQFIMRMMKIMIILLYNFSIYH